MRVIFVWLIMAIIGFLQGCASDTARTKAEGVGIGGLAGAAMGAMGAAAGIRPDAPVAGALNQAIQHWHTDSTRKRAISVFP